MEIIRITNINSKTNIPISSELTSRLGFLFQKAKKTPVYLVDGELMDKIYPPHKRVVIDEEKLKRNLEEYESRKDKEEDENFLERILERSTREIDKEDIKGQNIFIAVGVYVHSLDKMILSEIEKVNNIVNLKIPAIFICPERVKSCAKKLKISQTLLFAKVLYHELGHAYIHNPNKTGYVYKIIEESYCNAVAFSRFSEPSDVEAVMKVISEQPFEYQGYTYFSDLIKSHPFGFYPWYLSSCFPHPYFSGYEIRLKENEGIRYSLFSFIELLEHLYYSWMKGKLSVLWFQSDIFRFIKEVWNDKSFFIDEKETKRFFNYLAYAIVKEIL